jgi:hypothetical protein
MESCRASTPRISIALATHNGQRYLEEQLRSLAEQTTLPCELVACDDASTDSTVAILRSFAESAQFPVRIHQNPQPLGFIENFLKTAKHCVGDWIAYCDQDDIWLPRKLTVVTERIARNPNLVLVAHSADLVSDDLKSYGRRLPDFKRDATKGPLEMPPIGLIMGFAVVFSRELIEQFDPALRPINPVPPEPWQSHDQWVYLLANALGSTEIVAESLVLYRRHDRAVTGPHHKRPPAHILRESLATGAASYRHLQHYCEECADLLRRLAAAQSDRRSQLLSLAADRFSSLARLMAVRAAIYEPGAGRRAFAFARLLAGGGYLGGHDAFGWPALCKDSLTLALGHRAWRPPAR